MNLTSFTFLGFLVVFLAIYFIIPRKIKWIWILASSIFFLFYDNFEYQYIGYLLVILLSSYIFALLIQKYKNMKKSKLFCVIGVIVILVELTILRYTNLFGVTFAYFYRLLFNSDYYFNLVSIKVPLGISYYSLIMIGYIVDVHRNLAQAQKNIFKVALFMMYFPILTSGPFIRYSDMSNQLCEGKKITYKNLTNGLIRIAWGFFKILVISQRLGMFVDAVYGDLVQFNGLYVFIAMIFFTLQLYTNFSGSIDIIIGVSEIIDIQLPENFRNPFFSKTITELWRRWHITLGAWLKDYILYPMLKSNFIQKLTQKLKNIVGKKAAKKITLHISMFILWIAIGVWHGGSYNFIVSSGVLQFIYIFFEDLLEPLVKKINNKLHIKTEVFSYKLYQSIRTFLLFSFSMIFFRSDSVHNGINIIKSMFSKFNPSILFDQTSLFITGLDKLDFKVMIACLIVMFVVELMQRTGNIREKLAKQNLVFRWIIIYALLFGIIIFGCYGPGYDATIFIYRQF